MADIRLKVGDTEYDLPDYGSFTFVDALVVNRVTGLDLEAFFSAPYETKLAGLVAVAMRRANERLTFAQLSDLVLQLDIAVPEVVGPEVPPPVPPDEGSAANGKQQDPQPGAATSAAEPASVPD